MAQCDLLQGGRRTTQSVRTAQGYDCSSGDSYPTPAWDTPFGDPGFFFDSSGGDMFYGATDSNGDPCPPGSGGYAVIGCTHSRNMNPFYSPIWYVSPPMPPIQIVTPGAPANRGDNCASTNGLAVGFPLPGASQHSIDANPLSSTNNAATISNQSQIFVKAGGVVGTQIIGFLIGTKGDGYFFVPNVTVGVSMGPIGFSQSSAGIYDLPAPNVNAPADIQVIANAFNDFASRYGATIQPWLANALNQKIPTLGVTNCYSAPLPKYG